jgi:hypothetical protein
MSDIQESFEEETGAEDEALWTDDEPIEPVPLPPTEPPRRSHRSGRPPRRPPSLFWPLVLVGAGVVLLLSNLGYIPWQSWNVLWRLWPLLLVAFGVDLLIGRRSLVGTIVSAILIAMLIAGGVALVYFAQNIPALVEVAGPDGWRTAHHEYVLNDDIDQAEVTIDWTSVPGSLTVLEDSANLIEADVSYLGQFIFSVSEYGDRADVLLDDRFDGVRLNPFDFDDRDRIPWDVRLSPQVSIDLILDGGSGRYDFDLTGLRVKSLKLDAGSGATDLTLPADSSFEAEVDGGSGRIAITVPEGLGVRVELDSGSGSFRPDERFELVRGERNSDGVWETHNFDTADHTVVLIIDQGSGSIVIR